MNLESNIALSPVPSEDLFFPPHATLSAKEFCSAGTYSDNNREAGVETRKSYSSAQIRQTSLHVKERNEYKVRMYWGKKKYTKRWCMGRVERGGRAEKARAGFGH